MGYRFGPFEADFQVYELRREGERIHVDRKVFDLLRYLIEHRERVVEKTELLREVWGGDVVVDAVVATAIARLRKTLGQTGAQSTPIQTVHGRGYRFVAALETHVPSSQPISGGPMRQTPLPQLDTDVHVGLRDPFVGRDHELQRLTGSLDKALAGTLRVRLILGEPGIGKTRLCLELAARAKEAGARVCTGHCYEAERDVLMWPFTQVLRQALDGRGAEALRALPDPARAELAQLLPELGAPSEAPRKTTLEAGLVLFDAVGRLLAEIARREPLVIVLDDLHWADTGTLMLLGYLADALVSSRVLILGTLRDMELPEDHAHGLLLERLERSPSFKRIPLQALGVEHVARYMSEFTGQQLPARLSERVHECTGGNPFFVRETTRGMTWDALSAGTMELSAVKLPESARDVVRRRLALLPEFALKVLEAASVVGVRFELGALGPMLQSDTRELLAALDRALLMRLIAREPEGVGHYAFAHALVRDTLYDDLKSADRCALHLSAAAALERQRALRPAVVSEIAFHLHRALPEGDGNRVLEYGVEAGKQAEAAGDHEAAALWYARAYEGLCFVRDADVNRSAEVMLSLGQAHRASGRAAAAREALDRVVELSSLGGAAPSWGEAARAELARLAGC